MFCTQCGAPLSEGAKFCTNCGTQIKFAPVPPPAAPEQPPEAPAQPAPPQTEAWPAPPAAPVSPEQPPEAPAQPAPPQTEAWPAPSAAPVSAEQPPEAPAQPASPQTEAWPAPAQPSVPAEQPVAWSAPVGQTAAQPVPPQTEAWPAPPPQPKKKGKGLLIGVIAVVIVAALVCVAGFVWPGFFRSNNASPAEYYRAVETENIEALSVRTATIYENLILNNVSTDGVGVSGRIRIEPGDKVRQMLLDAAGDTLGLLNPDEDLKWFKAIGLTYDVSRKSPLLALNGALQLNDTDLLHLGITARAEDGSLWISVPELSDRVLQTTAEELGTGSPLSSGSGLSGGLDLGFAEKLDPIAKALPAAETLEALMRRYLTEAVALIENVERREGTMTVDDVAADYTVLVATVDADTAVAILEKLGPELREDPEIKSILTDLANASGKDGAAEYQDFRKRIDELLEDHTKLTEKMNGDVVITVYLDEDGVVHGRIIENSEKRLELLMPEKDGRFGLLIRYADRDGQKLMLFGSGKRSGETLSGELELEAAGEYYGVVELDGFDIEKLKDGYLSGGMALRPSASFWNLLENLLGESGGTVPDSVRSVLESLTFRLDLNTEKDRAEAVLAVRSGSETLATVTIDCTKSAAKQIGTPDGVEPSEWSRDITPEKLKPIISSLGEAGVPQVYTDLLDTLLLFALD